MEDASKDVERHCVDRDSGAKSLPELMPERVLTGSSPGRKRETFPGGAATCPSGSSQRLSIKAL